MKTEQPHWFESREVTLSESECLEVLGGNQVGRIVFDDEVGPVALPVNYAVEGTDIVIRTLHSGTIARNTAQRLVAFEVDEIDDYTESGCSVVVRGRADVKPLGEFPPKDEPHPWAEGDRHCIVRIRPEAITGRRLIPA
jgi:nitroimidazol reductase NimA-like FMN-containing flavoprotein (pyridoxamine 5'-phosphate oxidase superfamily)